MQFFESIPITANQLAVPNAAGAVPEPVSRTTYGILNHKMFGFRFDV
jgi:hypothetical protein